MNDWRVEEIESRLVGRYGAVISGADLRHLLGYRTGSAFRQAVHRGTLPLRTFFQPGRRGRSASSADVAVWMASLEAGAKGNTGYEAAQVERLASNEPLRR